MKITIEFNHEDIVRANDAEFEAFFVMVQAFAKTLKVSDKKFLSDKVPENQTEKSSAKTDAEKNFNRAEIETEIKKIALEGKEKGASIKIKEILKSFGVEKLSAVPDDKMTELLAKIQEAV